MNITLGYPDLYAYNMTLSTSTPYTFVYSSQAYMIPAEVPKYDDGREVRDTLSMNA
jgi:hypothetical protein